MDVVTNPCSRFHGVPVDLYEDSDHQFYYFLCIQTILLCCKFLVIHIEWQEVFWTCIIQFAMCMNLIQI